MNLRRSPRAAFSLAETLLALALLIVAAALLLGGLGQARKRSAAVHCLANLRAIGAASHAYAQEHHLRLPLPRDGQARDADGGLRGHWMTRLAPYLLSGVRYDPAKDQVTSGVLRCPSGEAGRSFGDEVRLKEGFRSTDYTPIIISGKDLYTYSIDLARSVIFVEKDRYEGGNLFPSGRESHFNLFITDALRKRHGEDGVNVLYGDGRAAYLLHPRAETLIIVER